MAASKSSSPTAVSFESEGVEDLQAKRREIERTLKGQSKAQAQRGLGFGSPSLEAALIMVGQRSGEGTSLDDEMVDVSEFVELGSGRGVLEGGGKKLQGRVKLSHSGERSVTRNFCSGGDMDSNRRKYSPIPKLTQCSSFVPTEKNHSPNADHKRTMFRMINREVHNPKFTSLFSSPYKF